jgi:hypothetical protein
MYCASSEEGSASINRTATGKAEILKALADSFNWRGADQEQTDQSMMQIMRPTPSGSFVPRRVSTSCSGTWDIYVQLCPGVPGDVNGLVPPASQRP